MPRSSRLCSTRCPMNPRPPVTRNFTLHLIRSADSERWPLSDRRQHATSRPEGRARALSNCSQCVAPAVHDERLTGDRIGFRGKEKRGGSAIAGAREILKRGGLLLGIEERIRIGAPGEVRADKAGRNRINANFGREGAG